MKKEKRILVKETALFEKERARLVKDHYGEYVVILGDEILGFYDSGIEAYHDMVRKRSFDAILIRPCIPPEEERPRRWHTLGRSDREGIVKKEKRILVKETALFEKERARLVKDHYGKYVVILGDEILGFYDSGIEAYHDMVKKRSFDAILIRPCIPPEEERPRRLLTLGRI